MNEIDYPLQKGELRRQLLKERKSLPVEEWRQKSDRLCAHLKSSPLFAQAQTILAYFSFRQEPDLTPLFSYPQFQWGFPRCVGKSLVWHSIFPGDSLTTGAYGISEPHPKAPLINPANVDLILVPAVACDVRGYRLGYGGGFYDRFLSLPEWMSKPTIGIVFEFGYLQQLPIDSWDKPLHDVCTEMGLKLCQ